jgi:hypothetical protein
VEDRFRAVLGEGWAQGVELRVDEGAALGDALRLEARPLEIGPAQRDDGLTTRQQRLDQRAADQALRAGY